MMATDTATMESASTVEATTTPTDGAAVSTEAATSTATPAKGTSKQDSRSAMIAAANKLLGEPEPETDTDAASDPVAEQGKAETKQTTEGTSKADPAELRKAREALKRSQYPEDVIEGLGEERIVELGQKLLKREADQSRLYQERQRLEQMLRDIEAEKQKGSQKPSEAPAKEVAAADDTITKGINEAITAALEPLASGDNADLFGDLQQPLGVALTGLGDTLSKITKTQIDSVKGEYQQVIDGLKEQLTSVHAHMDRVALRQAVEDTGLIKDYPELKRDAALMQKIVGRARSLANLENDYFDESGEPDWNKLVTDAAAIEFKDRKPTKQQVQAQLAKRSKQAADGQVGADTGGVDRSSTKSPKEQMIRIAQLMASGKSADEAREAVAG